MGWYFEESPAVRDAAGLKRSATKITPQPILSTRFQVFLHKVDEISDFDE